MYDILHYEHPFVCTDAVIFTVDMKKVDNYRKLPDPTLKLLLYNRRHEPFQGKWSLPGGFLNIDELPEENIRAKLAQKVGFTDGYLEQLCTFCALERDPRARVVSIAYMGLVEKITTDQSWFIVTFTPNGLVFENETKKFSQTELAFDHYKIILTAIQRLQSKLWYSDLIFYLLPETFTLTHMQTIFETILQKKKLPQISDEK